MFSFLNASRVMRGQKISLQTSLIVLLFASGPLAAQVKRYPVDLKWTLISDTLPTIPARVPGNNMMALETAGLIPDPMVGDNESRLQWIANRDWTFRSEPFEIPDSIFYSGSVRMFRFPSISPGAEVFLNGRSFCSCESAFEPCWEFDPQNMFQARDNVLEIRFKSPTRHADSLIGRQPHPLPGDASRAVVRRPQYQFGWDWAPRLLAVGLGAVPEMVVFESAILESASVQTRSLATDRADLVLRARVFSLSGKSKLRISLCDSAGHVLVKKEFKTKNEVNLKIPFSISHPRLWTTHDCGVPFVYNGMVKVEEISKDHVWLLDSLHVTFGIRTAELVREKDRPGETFFFKLNGERVFARGANYVPQDIFPERVSPARYRELLLMARDANVNMLRVWGGGLYERDLFYHLCDSLGIMVWQDFMFACAMYPGDRDFAQKIKSEADYQTCRLAAHPSVVAWCGNNEVSEGWHRWGWQAGLSAKEKKAVWKSYRLIFQKVLHTAVKQNTRQAYIESSPALGRGDPKYTTRGSVHNWWVWHDAAPFENYLEQVPRFMAEYGFQSFPAKATLDSVLNPDDLNIYSDPMQAHQKHSRGFDLMGQYQDRWNLRPKNFEAGMWLSQIVQAEGIGMGIRAHRTGQPYCSGSLIWQFNDCWPAVSWSMVDYYHRPKALYYRAKRDFAPHIIMHREQNDSLFFHFISDTSWPAQFRGMASVTTYHAYGEMLHEWILPLDTPPTATNTIFLSGPKSDFFPARKPDQCYSVIELAVGAGETYLQKYVIFHGHPGLFDLSPSLLKMTQVGNGDSWIILLESTSPARFVELKANVPGRWSDNFVDVVPGHPVYLLFTPDTYTANPQFTWISLYEVIQGGKIPE